jgi:hypothetical protein
MNYTQQYQLLKNAFDPGKDRIEFPGSDIACYMVDFESANNASLFHEIHNNSNHGIRVGEWPDDGIIENRTFKYPVFMRNKPGKQDHAIILLHGLNERSWVKYLVWAHYLTEHTGHPVILFPIAFHMNRSPQSWGNPRIMADLLNQRRNRLGDVPWSTFANVALSERLTDEPLRFYASGQQSAQDLTQLTRQLHSGGHTLFEKGTNVDFFSYSIGAFLSQILFLGNPDGLYTESKLFLFCGGAFFDEMNGVSKLIMDQPAFSSLREYYLLNFQQEASHSTQLSDSLYHTNLGQAFLSMLAETNLKNFREERFKELGNHVYALSLVNDQVIPAKFVYNSLNPFCKVDVMDMPYPYSHEVPFPVIGNEISKQVDKGFNNIFRKAAAFLC